MQHHYDWIDRGLLSRKNQTSKPTTSQTGTESTVLDQAWGGSQNFEQRPHHHITSPEQTTTMSSHRMSLRKQLEASNLEGLCLSSEDEAIFRFVQGMSAQKKEQLATDYIKGMTNETKAQIESEILTEAGDARPDYGNGPASAVRSTVNKLFFSPRNGRRPSVRRASIQRQSTQKPSTKVPKAA